MAPMHGHWALFSAALLYATCCDGSDFPQAHNFSADLRLSVIHIEGTCSFALFLCSCSYGITLCLVMLSASFRIKQVASLHSR